MFTSRLLAIPCTLALLAASATAGNVLRVGPTQTYVTIQAAINAAVNGDVIIVDSGVYPAFVLAGKRVSILPSGTDFEVQTATGTPAIDVNGIPAGMTVSILGAVVRYTEPSAPAVRISNNPGAVRLSRLFVSMDANLPNAAARAAVEVESTDTFWLYASQVTTSTARSGNTVNPTGANDGISGVELLDSNGVLQEVTLNGYDNAGAYAGDGLRVRDDSTAWLRSEIFRSAGSNSFFGGQGGTFGGHAVHLIMAAPAQQDRITMCQGADLHLGTGTTDGGYYGINNNAGKKVNGSITTWRVPDLCSGAQVGETQTDLDTVSIGTTFTVRVWTLQASVYGLAWSANADYERTVTGYYGRGLIDQTNYSILASGSTSAATAVPVSVTIPNLNALRGLQMTFQTAFGPSTANALSGPALVVVQ